MMESEHGASLTATGEARSARRAGLLARGIALAGVMLLGVSCVAQQADLVKLETDLKGKIAKLDREKEILTRTIADANRDIAASREDLVEARARINSELRGLRDESLPALRGILETEAHRLTGDFRQAIDTAVDRLTLEFNGRVDDLEQRIDGSLDQRDKTMRDQFAGFRDSLVQFKDTMGQVDAQLEEERRRAADTESALREKLDADTESLKTYLADDVKGTIESINSAMETNEGALQDRLDAQGTQLSEVVTRLDRELTALQETGTRHGADLEAVSRSMAQLRDAMDTMAGALGERSDGDMGRMERLEQAQTAQTSTTRDVTAHLDSTDEGLRTLQEALQGYVDQMKQISGVVEQLREEVRASKKPSGAPSIELP